MAIHRTAAPSAIELERFLPIAVSCGAARTAQDRHFAAASINDQNGSHHHGGDNSHRSIPGRDCPGCSPHRRAPADLVGRRLSRRRHRDRCPCLAQPARPRHRPVDGRPGGRRHASGRELRHRRRHLVGGQQPDRPGHRRLCRRAPVRHAAARRWHHPRRADLGRHLADHDLPVDHGCRRHCRRRVQRRRQHPLDRRPGRRRGRSPGGRRGGYLAGADPGAGRATPAPRAARSAQRGAGPRRARQCAAPDGDRQRAGGGGSPRARCNHHRPAGRHKPGAGESAARPAPGRGPAARRSGGGAGDRGGRRRGGRCVIGIDLGVRRLRARRRRRRRGRRHGHARQARVRY